jgi:hypothetical protein
MIERKQLVIRPSCGSCGLSAEASTPWLNPRTGQREFLSAMLIDAYIAAQVAVIEKHIDGAKMRNECGQFKLAGVASYFCSLFCLMQGLFCYGRCAGCARSLPRKKLLRDWHAVHNGEGKFQYGKFEYCSPECKKLFSNRETIWAAQHVLETLAKFGVEVQMPAEFVTESEAEFRGRCANKNCGKGKDARGNRVRAKVPARGDFCSSSCQRAHAEVSGRVKAPIPDPSQLANSTLSF